MAEEWSGARYGAGMVGQPGVCRSMTTSSSSTSTTRARGFSKPCWMRGKKKKKRGMKVMEIPTQGPWGWYPRTYLPLAPQGPAL